ncbi:hypothetical protein WICPIJ_004446 [Wickerhamomyces pijperi]|uniref:Uncharacterized protein n=1 Tax=Wickerhamomyces pijperi TaxID=599730 RepID=A0A9P8TMQ9_WICPI|nr:hypothetical protein WICPIJ_004446 [Wickerhamomyces pijperi]
MWESGGDGVVVWTTLVTWEDGEVDWVFQVVKDFLTGLGVDGSDTLSEENHGTSWTSEGLVGGGGDNVGVFEWGWDHASSDQTGDVGHVDNQVGTNLVGDFSHSLVVDQSTVSRGTGNQHLWSEQDGVLLQGVVVNDTGFQVNSVWHGFEVGGNSRDLSGVGLVTVGQVTTVWQIQTHQSFVWLHDGLQFDSVNVLVTTVVTGTWVTFGVLVTHWSTQGIEDGGGGEVFRGDKDNGVSLTVDFILDDLFDFWIGVF